MADEKSSVSFSGDPEDLLKKFMRMRLMGDAGEKAIGYIAGDSEMEKLQKEALKLDIATKKKMLGDDYSDPLLSPRERTLALGLVMRSLPEAEATNFVAASAPKSAKIGENLLEQILRKTIPDVKGILNVGSGAKFKPAWSKFIY